MKIDLVPASLVDDDVFRAATLRQTLLLAQSRKRVRERRRCTSAAAAGLALLVSIIGSLVLHRASNVTPLAMKSEPPLATINTAPLLPSQRVHTTGKHFSRVSTSAVGLAIIRSETQPLSLIATETSAPQFELISDHQLMAAFPAERPALIARGTGDVRLVFY